MGIGHDGRAELLDYGYRPVITEHAEGVEADYRAVPVSDTAQGDQADALHFAKSIVGDAAAQTAPPGPAEDALSARK